jgi:cytochrome c556
MRIALAFAMGLLTAQATAAQAPATSTPAARPPTMKELMLDLIFPASDTLFYVTREDLKETADWNRVQVQALALQQAAIALTTPGQAWGGNSDQWKADAKLLLDVAVKAYRGAKERKLEAITDLNAELYESCQSCHVHYRPGYRRRPS